MDKKLRIHLLKTGGKRALQEYNKKNRIPPQQMNMGTRVHVDTRYKKPKYSEVYDYD